MFRPDPDPTKFLKTGPDSILFHEPDADPQLWFLFTLSIHHCRSLNLRIQSILFISWIRIPIGLILIRIQNSFTICIYWIFLSQYLFTKVKRKLGNSKYFNFFGSGVFLEGRSLALLSPIIILIIIINRNRTPLFVAMYNRH